MPQDGLQRKVIDDKEFKRLMRQAEPGPAEFLKERAVTLALIAVNVVLFVVEAALSGSITNISSRVMVDMGAMYAPLMQSPADLTRLVTPMFLHMDIYHLAFNMVALYSVGDLLEYALGKVSFVLLYFIAGITGNMAAFLADVLLTGGNVVSAGASTSVFGLFVAAALLRVLLYDRDWLSAEYSKGMLGIIAANVLFTLLVPGISIAGHLGGAVGGAIAMLAVPSAYLRMPYLPRILVALAWLAAVAAALVWQGVIGI